MTIKWPVIIFVIFSYCLSYGQQSEIDSLKRLLEIPSSDSTKTNHLINLADLYKSTSIDSSLSYVQLAKDNIDTTEYSALYIKYVVVVSNIFYVNGDVKRSLKTVNRVLNEKDINLDYKEYADLSFRKALCLFQLAEYDQSTEILLATIDTLSNYNDIKRIAGCYNSLGNIMRHSQRTEQALEYYKLSYEMHLEIGAKKEAYRNMANIAVGYSLMNLFEESIPHFKKTITGSKESKDTFLEAFAYGNLGLNYVEIVEPDSALLYLNLALSMYQKMNNKIRIARTSSQMSRLYLQQKQFSSAVDILLPSLKIAKDLENLELEDAITLNLSKAYKGLEDYKNAYLYSAVHDLLRDSILTDEVRKAVNEAQTIHETEKKEAEILRLSLEDQLSQERIAKQQFALGGSVIGLGLLSFLLYRMNGQKRKIQSQSHVIEKSLHEKETLLREIHHRVKNNLQIISSLLGLQSRSLNDQVAIDALTQSRARVQSMSLIHQNLYQRDNLTGIHVKEYFEKLSSNLINTYSISEDIVIIPEIEEILLDVDSIIPIGLILNELLTNSLKHAFPKRGGTISVSLSKVDEQLFLKVSDDGVGIENPEDILNGEGYGYELVTSLVEKLEGAINIASENGTQIIMSFSNFLILDS